MAILSLILSGVNTNMHAKFVSQQPEREKSSVSKHVKIQEYEMSKESRKGKCISNKENHTDPCSIYNPKLNV